MRILLKELRENLGNAAKCGHNKTVQLTYEASKLCLSMITPTISIFTAMDAPSNDEPFDIMVDYNLFNSILNQLNNKVEYINLVKNNGVMLMSTDPGENYAMMRLPVIASTSKPDSKVKEEYLSKISVDSFYTYTSACVHAAASASLHDARMEAFYIEDAGNNKLRVTALDGHRVAMRDSLNGETPTTSIMVSAYNMNSIASMMGDSIKIAIPKSGNFVRITGKNTVVVMPAVNGTYYNVDQLLARSSGNETFTIKVNKTKLLDAIRLAELVNQKLIFKIADGKISILANSVSGETTCDVQAVGDKDAKIEIGFNAGYLVDALSNIKANEVDMTFSNNISPCIITSSIKAKRGGNEVVIAEKEIVLPVRIKA